MAKGTENKVALQMPGHSQIFFKRPNLVFYDLKLFINKGGIVICFLVFDGSIVFCFLVIV